MTTSEGSITRRLALAAGAAVVAAGAVRILASRTARQWKANDGSLTADDFVLTGSSESLTTPDGGTVNVRVAGDGPTIIFGHGIAGHLDHWGLIGNRLARQGRRVVAFDQRGHGSSSAGTAGFGLEGLALDLATVIERFGEDGPVALVGHSMGGIGIQALARHRPDLFPSLRGVMLVASTPRSRSNPLVKVLNTEPTLRMYRRLLRKDSTARWLMRPGFGTDPAEVQIDELRRSWDRCPDETLRGFGTSLEAFDLTPDLPVVSCRTVVVCGDRDQVTPLLLSRELADAIPDVTLEIADDAGHMIIWERVDNIVELVLQLSAD